MATVATLGVNVTANAGSFNSTLHGATGTFGAFVGKMTGMAAGLGGAMNAALGPVGLAIGGIFAIKGALNSAAEAEEGVAKLDAVLTATGGAAGLSSEEIQGFASELQDVTTFSDDATVAGAGVLATFKEIKGDVFKDALVSAQDLSTVMKQDLQGSIVQIGKALNDPVKGVSALSKVGVSFTEQQKAQIKAMQAAGDVAGAQQIILAELKSEFGGAAEAVAGTLGGQMAQMSNTVGDIGETVGGIFGAMLQPIIPIVTGVANGIIAVFETITPPFQMVFGFLGDVVSSGMNAIMGVVGPIFDVLVDTVVNTFFSLLDYLAPVITAIEGTVSAGFGMLISIGQEVWGVLTGLFNSVMEVATNALNAIGVNSQSTANFFNQSMEWIKAGLLVLEFGFTHWKDLGTFALLSVGLGFVSFGNTVAHWATVVIPDLLSWFGRNWFDVFTDIVNLTATVASNIWTNLKNLWDGIVGLFSGEGFTFEWTPLTEGFESAIKELPKIAERELGPLEQQLTDQVSALGSQINNDFASFNQKRTEEMLAETAEFRANLQASEEQKPTVTPADQKPMAAQPQAQSGVGALLRGSVEAFKAENSGSAPIDKLVDTAEEQLSESKAQTGLMEDIAAGLAAEEVDLP